MISVDEAMEEEAMGKLQKEKTTFREIKKTLYESVVTPTVLQE